MPKRQLQQAGSPQFVVSLPDKQHTISTSALLLATSAYVAFTTTDWVAAATQIGALAFGIEFALRLAGWSMTGPVRRRADGR